MPEPLGTIPYADTTTQHGIVFEWDEKSLRISMPRMRLRDLSTGQRIGLIYILIACPAQWVSLVKDRGLNWASILVALGYLLSFAMGLVALYAMGWIAFRVGQTYRRVIEIDSSHLHLYSLHGKRASKKQSIPRSQLGVIKPSLEDGKLVIYVTGQSMIELFVSRDKQVVERVASEINSAVHDLPRALSGGARLKEFNDSPPLPMKRGLMRTMLLIVAGIFSLTAVVLVLYGGSWLGLSLFVLLFAAIPAGIAMGMQKKDYYL